MLENMNFHCIVSQTYGPNSMIKRFCLKTKDSYNNYESLARFGIKVKPINCMIE